MATQLTPPRPFYQRKRYLIPAILLIGLVVLRILLPGIVKKYVNKSLAELPGYYGQVADIDIALWRGAYQIDGLYLNVVDGKTEVPFLKISTIDISVEWKSLFKGRIVSEVYLRTPEVIYLLEDQESVPTDEAPEVEDWTKVVTDLVPIEINRFEITNGKVSYVEVNAEPNIDLQFTELDFNVNNLSNVEAKPNTLPSPFRATAVSFGGGNVALEGQVNWLKEVPDIDLTFSLTGADARALNDWTDHYAGIDFDSGTFELSSEVAIADGFMKGYIKPLLINGKMVGSEDSFREKIWEGFLGFFKFLFTNQKTETLATKVPLEGDLNNVEAGIWPTVTNIFKNAWIQAFKQSPDEEIEYEDALDPNADTDQDKTRKERRRERRAERKAEKEKEKENQL